MKPKNRDWEKFKLGDLYTVHNGLSKGQEYFGSGFPFLSFSTVFNHWFLPETLTDLVQSTENEQESYSILRGDVFITRTSETIDELGMSSVALKDYPQATYNGFTKRLRPIESNVVFPEFIGYYLRSPGFRERFKEFSTVTTRASLRNEDLLSMEIILPPLEEQRRIAEILSVCERVLTLKKELKAQKIKQKKWLMQKLLNPVSGVRLPGFMDEWETVTLGDLFDFSTSLSASRDKLGTDGIPYLHYGDIHKSSQTFIDVAMDWETLPKLKIGEIQDKYLLKDGDVVFVDASEDYEGASKYVVIYNPENRPFLAGLHTLPAHSKTDRLDRQFKRFCFQSHSVKTQVMFYLSGMKVYGLNRENIGKIKLSFPSLAEQTAIAEVLSAADRELDLLEEEIQAWERKKKALSQLLLRGIVRV